MPIHDREVLPTRTRTQKRVRRTRNRLLEAALAVFAERGVDATNIEHITDRADLGKGTFYRHFQSKDEIVEAMVTAVVTGLLTQIRKCPAHPDSLPEMLAELLRAHTKYFAHNPQSLVIFQSRLQSRPHRGNDAGCDDPLEVYLRKITAGISAFAACPIEPAQVQRLASAMCGFVSGFMAFVTVGLAQDQIEPMFDPLRRAFAAGASASLTDAARAVGTAGSPTTGATT